MESWLEPLHDAAGMRADDTWAIGERGVPSLELMEVAGAALATAVAELASRGPVRVVCGKGNNGGDGIVAARHLAATGFEAEVLLIWPAAELSDDAASNLGRLEPDAWCEVEAGMLVDALRGSGAVVDAIFGTGFEGAPRAPAEAAIEAINACDAPVAAADIASGVDASTGETQGVAVEATATVSFHAAKVGHWIAPGKSSTGELRVAPIGIPDGAPGQAAANLITDASLALPAPRGRESTKFSSGQVLVIGGSRGLTGAVCMAAESAARAGAGYATVAVPAGLEPIFEVKLTEVMSLGVDGPSDRLGAGAADQILAAARRAAAVVLGPGLGHADDSLELARALAQRVEVPLLIDADGLNAHAGGLERLRERPAPTVLTPHGGELGRLLGLESSEVGAHRLACAREAAERSGAIVVLKGDDTLVVDSAAGGGRTRLAISPGGSPALATAGTGDVLSGLVCALMARGLEPFAAACAGVHAHAVAGREAAAAAGIAESVVATDVIAQIPAALARGRR